MSATPTAATGISSRTSSASTASTPRLLGQRAARPTAHGRRGASTSHRAIARKTPAKAPRRMASSVVGLMAFSSLPGAANYSRNAGGRGRRCRCSRIWPLLRLCRSDGPTRRRRTGPELRGRRKKAAQAMDIFVQQLINGITLRSIYGLIAIGYTMVFGIIGMVNFAHGDVFMVSAFIGLITLLICTAWLGIGSVALALLIVLIVAMVLTSLVNWTSERLAYRPLSGSFRLAPLISATGMSILLSNFVQVAQGPRNKSVPPMLRGEFVLIDSPDRK